MRIYLLSMASLCFLILFLSSKKEANVRFPKPTEEATKKADREVEQLAKNEIFTLSPTELAIFVWDTFKRGRAQDFSYYDSNPEILSEEQADMPATILLHAHGTNQGEWLPLLRAISEFRKSPNHSLGPVFTLKYPHTSSEDDLISRIKEIKEIYQKSGKNEVSFHLVGHSLGGITSANYAYDPDLWVAGTKIKKVISIAGRLKNIEPPIQTPFYSYCYPLLPFIDTLWRQIHTSTSNVTLYTIAAENDWLLLKESVSVSSISSNNRAVANSGHALIARKNETIETVIQWLYKD